MNPEEPNHPKLEQALRALAKDEILVPPERDAAILGEIRARLASEREGDPEPVSSGEAQSELRELVFRSRKPARVPRRPGPWQKWLPLAASMVMAGLILYSSRPREAELADVNGDGAVNVIDALLVAEGAGRDVNGDGTSDSADAAEIASRAVKLGGGES